MECDCRYAATAWCKAASGWGLMLCATRRGSAWRHRVKQSPSARESLQANWHQRCAVSWAAVGAVSIAHDDWAAAASVRSMSSAAASGPPAARWSSVRAISPDSSRLRYWRALGNSEAPQVLAVIPAWAKFMPVSDCTGLMATAVRRGHVGAAQPAATSTNSSRRMNSDA